MKRVMFGTALAMALAAIAVTGVVASAQTSPPPGQHRGAMMRQGAGGPGQGPMGMLQHLNLTDDQRSKIQSLTQQQRQAHQAERQKLFDLQQQLKNTIFADAGPGDTAALLQQIATLESQLQADRVNLEKQIAAVLTAEQRKQVRDMPGPGFGFMGRGRGLQHGARW